MRAVNESSEALGAVAEPGGPLVVGPRQAERVRAAHAPLLGRPVALEESLETIERAARSSLPPPVASVLSAMSAERGPAWVLVRGLATEPDLPATPRRPDPASAEAPSLLSGAVLLGVATVLGEPLGYRAEKHGAILQSVFPVETERTATSNESSASSLDLHTELVFSRRQPALPLDRESPDFLLLWCLRSDPEGTAATLVTAVDDLCAGLSPAQLEVLAEPRFENRAPYSFTRDAPGERPWVGPAPILRGEGPQRHAALDLACGTRGLDPEADDALAALRRAAGAPGVTRRVRLRPGDLLIMDNRRCVHGRTPFPARFDGRDRWLLRVYVRRSLAGMEPVDRGSPRVF